MTEAGSVRNCGVASIEQPTLPEAKAAFIFSAVWNVLTAPFLIELIHVNKKICLSQLRKQLQSMDAATFYLLALVLGLSSLLWGFIELADDVMEGDTHEIDTLILSSLRLENDAHTPIGPAWLLQVAQDITALGGHTVLTLVVLIVAGYTTMLRSHRTTAFILTASIGGMLMSSTLKWLFGRTRPDIVPHLVEVSTASFPSGHAMLSAAIYLSLGAIVSQLVPRYRQKLYIIGTALLLTVLVGLSRVYLGVHYPSDVLAGWSAGTAWALICWWAPRMFARSSAR